MSNTQNIEIHAEKEYEDDAEIPVPVKKVYTIKAMAKPEKKKSAKSGSVSKMEKTFEQMMIQFQGMIQLNQAIQMSQMNHLQMMSQLIELKGSVIETRQDLSFKLKEINHRIDEVSSKRSSGTKRSTGAVAGAEDEADADYSHLHPLRMENVASLYVNRNIDDNYVRKLLKSKSQSAFMKIFDILYRCEDKTKRDIYPIRVLKAKTFQYYNEEGNWIIDTNGVNIIKMVCANISLLLSKVNNEAFGEEEMSEDEEEDSDDESGDESGEKGKSDAKINMFDFVDYQTYIQELDDKKVRAQILIAIRDLVVNHQANYKL
jgi:hypothetical protein